MPYNPFDTRYPIPDTRIKIRGRIAFIIHTNISRFYSHAESIPQVCPLERLNLALNEVFSLSLTFRRSVEASGAHPCAEHKDILNIQLSAV